MLFDRCCFFMLLCNMEQFILYLNLYCVFLKTAYLEAPAKISQKPLFQIPWNFQALILAVWTVLSVVILWPKVKFFINIPMNLKKLMNLEKLLFFGILFRTGSMQKVRSYDKNKFQLKHSFILLLFNYHKTPLSWITKFFKSWPADLHSQLIFPYPPVAMATNKKKFYRNFNVLSGFIIWHKYSSPMWTWLREKKSGSYPLKGYFRYKTITSQNVLSKLVITCPGLPGWNFNPSSRGRFQPVITCRN